MQSVLAHRDARTEHLWLNTRDKQRNIISGGEIEAAASSILQATKRTSTNNMMGGGDR